MIVKAKVTAAVTTAATTVAQIVAETVVAATITDALDVVAAVAGVVDEHGHAELRRRKGERRVVDRLALEEPDEQLLHLRVRLEDVVTGVFDQDL